MNIFALIKAVYDASEAGKQLANPGSWAGRATATARLVVLLNTALLLVNHFLGTEFHLGPEDAQAVATGISIIGMLVVDRLHVASNEAAGKVR
jgi:hypothetical protein